MTCMMIGLYNYYSASIIQNVFFWRPREGRWWITGFNTSFSNPDKKIMQVIGYIDFSEYPDLYRAVKEDNENGDELIFDDDYTV